MYEKYIWPAGDAKQIVYTIVGESKEVHVSATPEVSGSIALLQRSYNPEAWPVLPHY